MGKGALLAFCGLLVISTFCGHAYAQGNCTSDDYIAEYSQCTVAGTHDLLWYKDPAVNCTGGVDVPPPILGIPCNITCSPGEFLPLGDQECSPCPNGTYSDGASTIVNVWYDFPTILGSMTTYCLDHEVLNTNTTECPVWAPDTSVIMSGSISNEQTSVLRLVTNLLLPGMIRFQYRLDLVRENAQVDSFSFLVDGWELLFASETTTPFLEFATNLSVGFHVIEWQFFKEFLLFKRDADFIIPIGGPGPVRPPPIASLVDGVFISAIEIFGLQYADSECTECPIGYQQPNVGSSTCEPCPAGTFAGETGLATCEQCRSGQYSWQAQPYCTDPFPCVNDDAQVLYPTCSGGRAQGVANWLSPMICDSTGVDLPTPDPASISCDELCPPGSSTASGTCTACPVGQFSPGSNTPCTVCPAGTAATRYLEALTWNSILDRDQTTSCTGLCGTNGWRMRQTFIDSGAGHLVGASSVYQLNVDLEFSGDVNFVFSLNCSGTCSLMFQDLPGDSSTEPYSPITYTTSPEEPLTGQTPGFIEGIAAGTHALQFIFVVEDSPTPWFDYASIYSINVSNVATGGGAVQCDPCPAGSVSSAGSHQCTPCPAGSLSNDNNTLCLDCPGDTWTGNPDMVTPVTTCEACPQGTVPNAETSDCVNTCTFTIGNQNYDITALDAAVGILGPYQDGNNNNYYVNLCGRDQPTCVAWDGSTIQTHVCQQSEFATLIDGGFMPGYFNLTTDGGQGFQLTYEWGQVEDWQCDTPSGRYTTDILFICSPDELFSVGEPVYEDPMCHFNFQFFSKYACPVCSESDYSSYFTPCQGGETQQIFYWLDPKECHDGVSLPPAVTTTCNDANFKVCDNNQKVSPPTLPIAVCEDCDVGQYSVGGGLLISNWTENAPNLPAGFFSSCTAPPCTHWSSEDSFTVHSGIGDSSLLATFTFLQTGSISFSYKVYSTTNGAFQFFVDDVLQLSVAAGENVISWEPFTYGPLAPGSHTFRWEYKNGLRFSPTLLLFQGVSITDVTFYGLGYHADSCMPCPMGTRSLNSTELFDGHFGCVTCDADYFSPGQQPVCTFCGEEFWSLPGTAECTQRHQCTIADYVLTYGPCQPDGTRLAEYVLQDPVRCIVFELLHELIITVPLPQTVPCEACPIGTFLNASGDCEGCARGSYYSSSKNECVDNPRGTIIEYSIGYFGDTSLDDWPTEFSTGCSGFCGTDGWRILTSSIDSGFHGSNTVDSYVQLFTTLVVPGSISFQYAVNTSSPNTGLVFMLDNQVVAISSADNTNDNTSVTVPLSAGSHEILWNFHQEGGQGVATVSNIVVKGVPAGASNVLIECPAGTFSNDPTDSTCTPCPAGTFAANSSATNCTACPVNTYSLVAGATSCTPCESGSYTTSTQSQVCTPNCAISIGSTSYNLSLTSSVSVTDASKQAYSINVCGFTSACPNSHVCLNPTTDPTSAGSSFRVVPTNSTSQPFTLVFEHGDSDGCVNNTQRTTNIEFTCNPDATNTLPTFSSVDGCTYNFVWDTASACPVCTDADYHEIQGVCSGGKRQISKTRINNCNGNATLVVPPKSCHSRDVSEGSIIGVSVALGAVCIGAALMFWRHRSLASKYGQLLDKNKEHL